MKRIVLVSCLLCTYAAHGQVHADTNWFNVTGDAADAGANTVEVDPVPIEVSGDLRTMRVRVSRATERKNWEGVTYRSYVSEVVFDCARKTARYRSITFYMQPAWRGEVSTRSSYSDTEPRAMEFRDITPNPTARLLRAACQSGSVTNN